jgi:hypothetical protein
MVGVDRDDHGGDQQPDRRHDSYSADDPPGAVATPAVRRRCGERGWASLGHDHART